ncbi:hypothetical protein EVJ50_11500 [Synechococcus sp. RSCCF101]|uniref:hypothetical protein n=1 Tax=Synechococcus sp. RSCCF101 TaxID=2511069 RepID=UPI001243A653|nr:hypothetical protein [Synechococcus sp. RSCCF101]QEY32758.1 hypothetical protein EVJ50_11500 [Synechococcus sp. RSCCF101]
MTLASRQTLQRLAIPVGLAPLLLAASLGSGVARAGEIKGASGLQSLGSVINGIRNGSCTAGHCSITGGTGAGSNLFHRFEKFDTRGSISGASINNDSFSNVIVGVIDPAGSFINKMVALSSKGNLFWLSPGGISLTAGGGFTNVATLQLSTATTLAVGSGFFDVYGSTASQVAGLRGIPIPGSPGLSTDPASLSAIGLSANGDLTIDDGLLTVDHSLLLDSQGGHLLLNASSLSADGGTIALAGRSVSLESSSLDVSNDIGSGGSVSIDAADIVIASSSINASGATAGGSISIAATGSVNLSDSDLTAIGGDGSLPLPGGAGGDDTTQTADADTTAESTDASATATAAEDNGRSTESSQTTPSTAETETAPGADEPDASTTVSTGEPEPKPEPEPEPQDTPQLDTQPSTAEASAATDPDPDPSGSLPGSSTETDGSARNDAAPAAPDTADAPAPGGTIRISGADIAITGGSLDASGSTDSGQIATDSSSASTWSPSLQSTGLATQMDQAIGEATDPASPDPLLQQEDNTSTQTSLSPEPTAPATESSTTLVSQAGGSAEATTPDIPAAAEPADEPEPATTADAAEPAGGAITLQAADTLTLTGATLTANGSGSQARGGSILLEADAIALAASSIDASGTAAGGTVRIGGGRRGEDTSIRNASTLTAGADTTISVEATTAGDGGELILYASDVASIDAQLSATGGTDSGDGGFIETSAGFLSVTQAPDISATNGNAGTWLIDPYNIDIVAGTTDSFITPVTGPTYFGNGPGTTNSQLSVGTLNAALDLGGTVTVDTQGAPSTPAGNIRILAPISTTAGSAGATLVFFADGNIQLAADITSTTNPLNVEFIVDADNSSGGETFQWSSGTLDLMGGTAKALTGDPATDGPTVINGAAVVASNTTFQTGTTSLATTSLTVDGAYNDLNGFSMSGGTLTGSGDITLSGNNTWSGGTITGTGNLTVSGPISISGNPALDGRTLTHTNAGGTSVFSSGAQLDINNGATFLNAAGASLAFNATTGNSVVLDHDSGITGSFNNLGILNKTGAGTMEVASGLFTGDLAFTNSGVFNINGGTVNLGGSGGTSSGTFNLSPGTELNISAGSHVLSGSASGNGTLGTSGGTLTLDTGFSLDGGSTIGLSVSGGTLNANTSSPLAPSGGVTISDGTLTGTGGIFVSGTTDWSGGILSGSGYFGAGGSLLISGNPTLSGRTLTHANAGPGSVLASGGQLDIDDGGTFLNNTGASFAIDAATSSTAALDHDNGATGTFTNLGTLTKTGAGTLEVASGVFTGDLVFSNAGTFNITAGTVNLGGSDGSSTGAFNLTSGATLGLPSSTLTLASSSTIGGEGTVAISGGTLNTADAPTIATNVSLSSGTLTSTAPTTLSGEINWSGGTISGSGGLTASGPLTISGTTFLDGRTLTHTNASGTSSLVSGGQLNIDNGGSFINDAAASFTIDAAASSTAALDHDNGATGSFTNLGTLTKTGAGTLEVASGVFTGDLVFSNDGTFNITAGTVNLGGSDGTSTGAFNLTSGTTLGLPSSVLTLAPSSTIGGEGTVAISGGTLNTATVPSLTTDVALSAGTLTNSGATSITGGLTWSGGTVSGTGGFTVNGPLAILSTVTVDSSSLTHTNASGTSSLASGSQLNLNNNASFINDTGAVFSFPVSGTATSFLDIDAGTASTFTNNGTLNKSGTGTLETFGGVAFNNNGSVSITEGTLRLNGSGGGTSTGSFAIASGASLTAVNGNHTFSGSATGSGTLGTSAGSASLTLADPFSFEPAGTLSIDVSSGTLAVNTSNPVNAASLSLSGGTLTGSTDIAFSGSSTFSGGTIAGTGNVTFAGPLAISTSAPSIDARTVTHTNASGTSSLASGSQLNLNNNASFINDTGAVFSFPVSGTATSFLDIDAGTASTFTNNGTLNKSGTGTLETFGGVAFNNNGSVSITEGTLRLNGSGGGTSTGSFAIASGASLTAVNGNHTFSGSATGSGTLGTSAGSASLTLADPFSFEPAGTLSIDVSSGTLAVNTSNSVNAASLSLSGGTLTGSTDIAFSGSSTFSGGTIAGTGNVTFAGPLAISTSAPSIDARTVTHTNASGTSSLASGSQLNLNNNASFINDTGAVFSFPVSGTATSFLDIDAGTASTFTNNGTLNKSGTGTLSVFGAVALNNQGTINLLEGTFAAGSTFTQAGTVDLATGTTLSASTSFTNNGTISGLGTIDLGGTGTLTNEGTLAPGGTGTAGTLTISGNLQQAAEGSLALDLGGTGLGQSDRIDISGTTGLDGSLDSSLINSYVPSDADQITLLQSTGAISGSFSALNVPDGFSAQTDNTPTPSTFDLLFSAAAPCSVDICWDGGGADNFWSTEENWSTDLLPGQSDRVALELTGGASVLFDPTAAGAASSSVTITSLFSTGDNSLTISSGALSIGENSTFNGAVTISGGSLASSGDTELAGPVDWSDGTIAQGSGYFGGGGSFTMSGPLSISGTPSLDGITLTHTNSSGASTVASGSTLTVGNGASLINASGASLTLPVSGTATTSIQSFGSGAPAAGTFSNAGTLTKSGSGSVSIGGSTAFTFNNQGATAIGEGSVLLAGTGGSHPGSFTISNGASLDIAGGAQALSATSSIGGAGQLSLSGGSLTSGGASTIDSAVAISGGSLNLTGGSLELRGPLNWSGGTIDGSAPSAGPLTVSGALSISGNPDLSGGSLIHTNASGISGIASGTTFQVGNGASFSNASGASLSVLANAGTTTSIESFGTGPLAAGSFINDGTLTKTGAGTLEISSNTALAVTNAGTTSIDAGTIRVDGSEFTQSGLINLDTGTTLSVSGDLTNAGTIQGDGTVEVIFNTLTNNGVIAPGGTGSAGTLTINGDLQQGPAGTLQIELGGTGTGESDGLEVGGTAFLLGNLNASLINGYTPADGDQIVVLRSGTSTPPGSITTDLTESIPTGFSSQIDNGSSPSTLSLVFAGGGDVCSGTICWDGGGTDNFWSNPQNWDTDLLPTSADQVALELSGGASILFDPVGAGAASTSVSIASLFSSADNTLTIASGTLTIDGPASSTLNGALTLQAPPATQTAPLLSGMGDLTLAGTTVWSGGTIDGTGALTISGPLTVSGTPRLDGRSLSHTNGSGTSSLASGTQLTLDNGAAFINDSGAVLNAPVQAGEVTRVTQNIVTGGVYTFENRGTLTKGGPSTLEFGPDGIFTFNLNNSGSFAIEGGIVVIAGNGQFAQTGSIDLASGVNLRFEDTTFTNDGLISGDGVIALGTGTLTNQGNLSPGGVGTAGAITISGDLIQGSEGGLELDIGGAGFGNGSDRLVVTGSTTLDGSLDSTLINGFSPTDGDQVSVLQGNLGITGDFSATNLPDGFTTEIDNSSTPGWLRLNFSGGGGATCSGTICWDGGGTDDFWSNPQNWNTDLLPTSSDQVALELTGGASILFDPIGAGATSSSVSIASLFSTSDNSLTLASGSLSIDGPTASTLNGALTLQAPPPTQTAPLLSGTGDLTLAGSTTWSGGTIDGTGALNISGPLTISGTPGLTGRTLTHTNASGSSSIAAGTQLRTSLGGSFVNANTAQLTLNTAAGSDSLFDEVITSPSSPQASFSNQGTLTKTGDGSFRFGLTGDIALDNQGSFSIDGGSVIVNSGSTLTQAGLINLNNSATLEVRDGFTNTSFITGNGTINLNGNTLLNQGTIAPAGDDEPIGFLFINGNLDQSPTGQLLLDLGGVGDDPSPSDRIEVSGQATLAGQLTASLTPAYSPSNGDQITVLSSDGGLSGSFSTETLPTNFSSQVNTSSTPQTLALLFSSAPGCSNGTICWDGGGDDNFWSNPQNWNTDLLPTSSDQVALDLSGGASILFDPVAAASLNSTAAVTSISNATALTTSGFSVSIASLFSTTDNALSIASGSLAVAGSSSLSGDLSLTGGTLLATGGLAASNLSITGAATGSPLLTGTGTLAVSDGFSQQGGTISGFSTIALSNAASTTPLTLSGGASILSPGAVVALESPSQPLNLNTASIDVSGAASGGVIVLDAPSINLSNTQLNTSGTITDGGTIAIGLNAPFPSSVLIDGSSLIADPPALGGTISIDGSSIDLRNSTLNVFGIDGGSLAIGSPGTNSLSLDAATTLELGPGAPPPSFTVGPGGTLSNDATVTILPLPTPPTPSPTPTPTPIDPAPPITPTPPLPPSGGTPTPPSPAPAPDPIPPVPPAAVTPPDAPDTPDTPDPLNPLETPELVEILLDSPVVNVVVNTQVEQQPLRKQETDPAAPKEAPQPLTSDLDDAQQPSPVDLNLEESDLFLTGTLLTSTTDTTSTALQVDSEDSDVLSGALDAATDTDADTLTSDITRRSQDALLNADPLEQSLNARTRTSFQDGSSLSGDIQSVTGSIDERLAAINSVVDVLVLTPAETSETYSESERRAAIEAAAKLGLIKTTGDSDTNTPEDSSSLRIAVPSFDVLQQLLNAVIQSVRSTGPGSP